MTPAASDKEGWMGGQMDKALGRWTETGTDMQTPPHTDHRTEHTDASMQLTVEREGPGGITQVLPLFSTHL